jgi:sterol desaturase/sphingolipid hydroxylase (fatty acid hydroxylase superfamily)
MARWPRSTARFVKQPGRRQPIIGARGSPKLKKADRFRNRSALFDSTQTGTESKCHQHGRSSKGAAPMPFAEFVHSITPQIVASMTDSVQLELGRYLIAAGAMSAVLWAGTRWVAQRRIQTRRTPRGDIVREVRQSLTTIAVFAVVDLITLALALGGVIAVNDGVPQAWTVVWQVVVLIVLHDAWFYWMHRALHTRALFRLTHMAHHRSRTPTPWAAYSFAVGEAVCEALAVPAMLLLIAPFAPIEALAVFVFLGHQIARNVIGHSGHELAWPGFTRSRWTGWLTTTTHHDLHHSVGHTNYGLYFTWWDRWLGTEHPQYHARFEAVAARRPVQQPANLAGSAG